MAGGAFVHATFARRNTEPLVRTDAMGRQTGKTGGTGGTGRSGGSGNVRLKPDATDVAP